MLTERFDQAFACAAEAHRHQLRKGTQIPYLSHLMAVAGMVLEEGADETTAIVALHHDVVEDQGGRPRLDDVRARFGDEVADAVMECSAEDKTETTEWLPRKQRYVEQMRITSPTAVHVSLADKLHNLRSTADDYRRLGDQLWSRFNAPGSEALVWYYQSLADVYAERRDIPNRHRVAELRRLIATLEQLLARPTCPACGAADVVPIVLGLPGPELMHAAAAGDVILLGCIPPPELHNAHCRSCGYEWDDPRLPEVDE